MENKKWMRNELFIWAIQYQRNPRTSEFPEVKFAKARLPCLAPRENKYDVADFICLIPQGNDTQSISTERKQNALLNPSACSKQDYILQTSLGRPWPFRCCCLVRVGGSVVKDPTSRKIIIIINKCWWNPQKGICLDLTSLDVKCCCPYDEANFPGLSFSPWVTWII